MLLRLKASMLSALRIVSLMLPWSGTMAQAQDFDRNDLDSWLSSEQTLAAAKISANLLGNGAVLASPSRSGPDYYFHWTRDAALTIDVVLDLYVASNQLEDRAAYLRQAQNYVDFSLKIQSQPTLSGSIQDHFANFGEPKFEVTGIGYQQPWGRPQTDGPALRAVSLMRIYKLALQRLDAQQQFSASMTGMKNAILADLEYTVYHWRDQGYDLWEEVRGQHFYNALVQQRALVAGAAFVNTYGVPGDAPRYLAEAAALEAQLARFWDPGRGYFVETINRSGGLDYKSSNLDSGVVLASLHALGENSYLLPNDDRILASAHALRSTFATLFPINKVLRDRAQLQLAPAIGRYPEDRYDGIGVSQGHPWFIATAALGELSYRAASLYAAADRIVITAQNEAFFADLPGIGQSLRRGDTLARGDAAFRNVLDALLRSGDEYLARVRYHAAMGGELTEQFDRYTGFERGATDLSWSYASLFKAVQARSQLIAVLQQ